MRVLLALVVEFDMELEQLDVKMAFLHGKLDEQIYMSQPEGFVVVEIKDKMFLLEKSLYGLTQSPRQQYLQFDEFMEKASFIRSAYNSYVYFKWFEKGQ